MSDKQECWELFWEQIATIFATLPADVRQRYAEQYPQLRDAA